MEKVSLNSTILISDLLISCIYVLTAGKIYEKARQRRIRNVLSCFAFFVL